MYNQSSQTSVWDKLSGTTLLTGRTAAVVKQTYLFFGLAVFSAIAGGYVGATSETLARFFSGWMGWIAALLLLNLVPRNLRKRGRAGERKRSSSKPPSQDFVDLQLRPLGRKTLAVRARVRSSL